MYLFEPIPHLPNAVTCFVYIIHKKSNVTKPFSRNNGDIIFESAPDIAGVACTYDPPGPAVSRPCQIVRIKLVNSPGPNDPGFLYQVEMGKWGQFIDPRLRGQ